jgi:DNA-directed RNA polymerase subunit N (RpoN/RPB10)
MKESQYIFVTSEYGQFHRLMESRMNPNEELGHIGFCDLCVRRHVYSNIRR